MSEEIPIIDFATFKEGNLSRTTHGTLVSRVPVSSCDRFLDAVATTEGTSATRCIAFFCHPNHDTEISCLKTCQSIERPPLYPPITAGDYLLSRLQATY